MTLNESKHTPAKLKNAGPAKDMMSARTSGLCLKDSPLICIVLFILALLLLCQTSTNGMFLVVLLVLVSNSTNCITCAKIEQK